MLPVPGTPNLSTNRSVCVGVKWSRWPRLIAVLLAAGALLLLAVPLGQGSGSSRELSPSRVSALVVDVVSPLAGRLSAYGIDLQLPKTWDGSVTYSQGQLGPVLQATTALLKWPDIKLNPFAASQLSPGDFLLVLQEFVGICPCRGFESATLPISIRSNLFWSDPGVPNTRAFADWAFRVADRYFYLWAEFGDREPGQSLNAANGILRSLEVKPATKQSPTEPAGLGVVQPPTFEQAPGWSVVTSGPFLSGGEDVPVTWATNEPISAGDLACASREGTLCFPRESLAELPPNGVFIVASLPLPGESVGPPNFSDDLLPLTLSDVDIRTSWEGQPAKNVPEYLILARVDGAGVDVRIYFGALAPGPDILSIAQSELDTLSVPQRAG